ncbi:putative 2-hydroxyacid dehydrogenase [Xylaria digitata]|nr:putative 2-hydroxyacid dehydrogenase [Xylaria digitata]
MSSSKPFILFFNPVRHAKGCYEDLQRVARTGVITSTLRQEFYEDIKNKYKDITAIYGTSASGTVAGNFDEDLIQHLPESCKFICHNGAGYDQIDPQACLKRRIVLTYTPDAVTEATADLALWLFLGALRQINPSLGSLRAGNFKKGVGFDNDPQGKALGILGMGRIGRALKKRADPFGFVTRYHNRSPVSKEIEAGVEYVSYEKLLAESDIISVHVPLNASTKHLIKTEDIAKMKDGVVIVNTARGAIIDEAALADALESGKIGAAGLDVYEKKPVINEKLLKQERALLVPHLGTHTTEILAKMEA